MTVDKFGRIARRVAMGLIPMESKGDDAVVVPDVEEDDDHDQRRGRYVPRGTRDGAAPPAAVHPPSREPRSGLRVRRADAERVVRRTVGRRD
jgi:hypothetical protein